MAGIAQFYFNGYTVRENPSVAPSAGRQWEVFRNGVLIATDAAPSIFTFNHTYESANAFLAVDLVEGDPPTSPHSLGAGYYVKFKGLVQDVYQNWSGTFSLLPTRPYMVVNHASNTESSIRMQMRAQVWPNILEYRVQFKKVGDPAAVWFTVRTSVEALDEQFTASDLPLPVAPNTINTYGVRVIAVDSDGVETVGSEDTRVNTQSTSPNVSNLRYEEYQGADSIAFNYTSPNTVPVNTMQRFDIRVLKRDPNFTYQTIYDQTVVSATPRFIPPVALASGEYSIYIRAWDNRGYPSPETNADFYLVGKPSVSNLRIDGQSLPGPTTTNPTPLFRWDFVPNAGGYPQNAYDFRLFADTVANPGASIENPPLISSGQEFHLVADVLSSGQYTAGLRVQDAEGTLSNEAFLTFEVAQNQEPNDPVAPGVPGRVSFDDPGATLHMVVIRPDVVPANCRNLKLWGKRFDEGGFSLIAQNLVSGSRVQRTFLQVDTEYIYFLQATNTFNGGTSVNGPQAGIITNLTDDAGDATLPERPEMPTAIKRWHEADIGFVNWPERADTVVLRKDAQPIKTFVASEARVFNVQGLLDYEDYTFTLIAENEAGQSLESEPLVVTMVADDITQEWLEPDEGETVSGRVGLVAQVSATSGLFAADPVQIRVAGGVLSGVRDLAGTPKYFRLYDARRADINGPLTFTLTARNALGLYSLPLDRHVQLANTIARLTHYEHEKWSEPQGKLLGKIALVTILDRREPKQWIDAFVTSPGQGALPDYGDFAAVEKILRQWQKVPLDEVFSLLGSPGDTTAQPPTPPAPATQDIEIILRFTPPRLETRYLTLSTGGRRVRQIDLELIEILTAQPSKVFEATKDGAKLILDLSARGMGEAFDARRWRADKVVAVQNTTVKVCEIDNSSADWLVVIPDETKPPVAVEVIGANFYLAYADETGSSLWKHDGTDPIKVLSTPERITLLRQSGTLGGQSTLAYATATNKLFSFDTTSVQSTLLWSHSVPIIDVLFEEGVPKYFADADQAYLFAEGIARVVADPTPTLTGLGFYKGLHAEARVGAGVAEPAVYSTDDAGAFVPTWTFENNAVAVRGLGRLLIEYVPAEGDPLKGGAAPVDTEILVVLIETSTEGGGYIAYIERSKQTDETSVLAGGIQRLVVVPENQKKPTT